MPATDAQMQAFADDRIRVRAEQCRALVNSLRDDKAAIDAVYDRASNGAPWNDDRTEPPKLLTSADVLAYNAIATLLLAVIDGTAVTNDVQTLHSNWAVFQAACVRPVG